MPVLFPVEGREVLVEIALTCYFFDRMCELEHVVDARRPEVAPSYFLGWLRQHLEEESVDVAEVLAKCNATQAQWENWRALFNRITVESLWTSWPHIALARREAPQNKLTGVQASILLKFADGRIWPLITRMATSQVAAGVLAEGNVCACLRYYAETVVGMIVTEGLDGLHRTSDDYGGDKFFDPLMALVLGMLGLDKNNFKEPKSTPAMNTILKLLESKKARDALLVLLEQPAAWELSALLAKEPELEPAARLYCSRYALLARQVVNLPLPVKEPAAMVRGAAKGGWEN
jgi:hypothetical protein